MGRQHRIALVCAIAVAAVGCGKSDAEKRAEVRREVLRADNLQQKHLEELAESRLFDANGELLPSKVQAGGITLPRGYTPKLVLEREWTYEGEVPFHKLEQYFLQRLSANIEHPANMITHFGRARPVGEPNAQLVEVDVMPVSGRPEWSSFHILQPAPPDPQQPMTAAQIAADIERRHRNAR